MKNCRIEELQMTDETRGWENGPTVAFFFKTDISRDWEHIIYGQFPTLPRILPPSDTRTLTPPPIRKNSQFFTKHQKPQQNDSFPIKNQKSKIKNPITLPSPDRTGPNSPTRVPHPLAPLCPFKLPAQAINCLHPSPKPKTPDCLIR